MMFIACQGDTLGQGSENLFSKGQIENILDLCHNATVTTTQQHHSNVKAPGYINEPICLCFNETSFIKASSKLDLIHGHNLSIAAPNSFLTL